MSVEKQTRNVTIKDVAREANVALGTVSRIINGNKTVAPELRKHVEAVIRELGYRPNPTAQTLRTQRTHAIGIIVTDLSQPIAAKLVAVASDIARQKGFAPIVGDFLNDVAAEENLLNFMAERNVDGMLLTVSSDENSELLDRLGALKIPIVLWERDAEARFRSVRTDHRQGALMAAQVLRERGRKHVVLVAGHENTWTGREQVGGFRDGLQGEVRLTVGYTGRFSAIWLRNLLNGPETVDAVVANVHDIPTVLQTLAAQGRSCPRDVSVISIGDDPFLEICAPPVSAIRLRPELVAERAMLKLLAMLDQNGPASNEQDALIAPDIVLRASV